MVVSVLPPGVTISAPEVPGSPELSPVAGSMTDVSFPKSTTSIVEPSPVFIRAVPSASAYAGRVIPASITADNAAAAAFFKKFIFILHNCLNPGKKRLLLL